ncbi:MAG: hypothetical protein M3N18_02095 [Actinomycetota bacterium]|nr:hypothetical protein [Actinomycetota bacterium]
MVVSGSQEHCYQHDPNKAEQRRRSASKAGRARPNREIVAIRGRLSDLADDVLGGRVNRADAAVVGQLLGTVIRAIATELKVREQQDLAEKLAEIEEALERQKGRGAHGSAG